MTDKPADRPSHQLRLADCGRVLAGGSVYTAFDFAGSSPVLVDDTASFRRLCQFGSHSVFQGSRVMLILLTLRTRMCLYRQPLERRRGPEVPGKDARGRGADLVPQSFEALRLSHCGSKQETEGE